MMRIIHQCDLLKGGKSDCVIIKVKHFFGQCLELSLVVRILDAYPFCITVHNAKDVVLCELQVKNREEKEKRCFILRDEEL
jgi:hypothetical protein